MKRGWITIMCITLALAIAGVMWSVKMQGKKQARIAPLPEKTEEEKLLDQLRITVEGQNMRLVTVEQNEEGWNVGIAYDTNSTDLVSLLLQASSLFHGIARTKVKVNNIYFLTRTDELKDVYGHTLTGVHILELRLSDETFYKIKWDGFEPGNLLRVADEYWIHPEVERMAEEQKEQEQSSSGDEEDGQQEDNTIM